MKILKIILIILLFSAITFAGFKGPGSDIQISNVQNVKTMNDDTEVILEGFLLKKISKEHYLFKDSTGKIEVEIDDKDFRGIVVTPNDKIRIKGEVDKDFNKISIDVDYLEIIRK
jgi:uncharacterized protein (TIGR00156 family)